MNSASRVAPMVEPRLLNNLAAQLPILWPAHELLVWERASEFDLIHVQGRGDRLHGLTVVQSEDDLARAAVQAQGLCNWYWMVVGPDTSEGLRSAIESVRAVWRAGVLEWRDGGLHKLQQAPPRPGIFVMKYPDLRAEWRKISSW